MYEILFVKKNHNLRKKTAKRNFFLTTFYETTPNFFFLKINALIFLWIQINLKTKCMKIRTKNSNAQFIILRHLNLGKF